MSEIKHEKTSRNRYIIISVNVLLVIAVIVAIGWGISTYFDLGSDLYTDDAQVEEYINPVNSRIPGYIKKVYFQEHHPVKKGDTLVTIDDREYKIQVEEAEAAYLSALASRNVSSSSASTVEINVDISASNINVIEARLINARKNLIRYENLLKDGAATQQQYDQVKSDYDALNAQRSASVGSQHSASLSAAEARNKVSISDAEIKRTHAALDLAKLNLSYTVIIAPYEGVAGRVIIQEGQLLQASQNLLILVRNDNKWVIANYMETQVAGLHLGQQMRLRIDGLGDQELKGKVVAISEATGSLYSAIPLDNSTGNFVKVRQRVPVRIEFVRSGSNATIMDRLRAGMNVEVRLAK